MAFFVISYMILSLIYFAYWFSKNRQEGVFRLSVILFLPVSGFLLFLTLWLRGRFMEKHDNDICISDVEAGGVLACGTVKGFDEKRAMGLVPMEEVLLLNNNRIKRRKMLDILKDDISKYPMLLKIALSNEDTETSHYAATGIVELKRKLLQSIQEWTRKCEGSKDREIRISYAYALKAYQSCGLLDEVNEKKIKAVYQAVLKELLEVYIQDEAFFVDRINYEIAEQNYELASFYCEKFLNAHKQSEKPYLMYLKLFYTLRDRKSFDDTLRMLDRSLVSLTHSTWSIIKFWTEGRV